ncbi:mannose-6-phosphate isomerase, class I [Acidilutibacter cellobiosedens]|jgi:mannose-6-phosphate isomerase|uniref:mannose-6-phosphate isomerase n=1 Tax=Acidilutibacter cellobiosedens TaxID=2507161 RepID=A0A410Q9M2_9FIRM|nr:mannose-6-phosphate isomerase, class I [Acidilutibacter cellobiosedens]MBE6081793.1 mannose-6-phosphate isomerase, class I [Tissierellaceae bacterium]QAT60681.1 mannose-6-phosphate isomerase, class I [Acidilutibacter cellobiosedens]
MIDIGAIFFEPVFKEKIWGGDSLRNFGYNLPSDKTGECWAFAAHHNGQSIVKNEEYKGKTLGDLWKNNRELFGNIKGDKFPLLVKIIDAKEDLSVQVHPDDEYAFKNENGESGKTECWYIIDCKENSQLILGVNAQSRTELEEMIDNSRWNELLRTIPIKKGDFVFVPSGTVHALKGGTLVLEIQQNSDITYRLYDYDRRDSKGNLRELHIEKSKAAIEVPYVDKQFKPVVNKFKNIIETKLVKCDYFTVYKFDIKGKVRLKQDHPFMLFSIIDGEGNLTVNEKIYKIKKGDHFMLPKGVTSYILEGKISLIVSYI